MLGVISEGIKLPIIRQGDDLKKIIIDSILSETKVLNIEESNYLKKEVVSYNLNDFDVVGITESLIARAQGNYVSIDEVASDIKKKMNNPDCITLYNCIYSRNRFAMILKAIARAANKCVNIYMPNVDEVGNVAENHPFTGINYRDYYKEIVESEGKICYTIPLEADIYKCLDTTIYCGLHDYKQVKAGFPNIFTLADFCTDKCEYGLLGCNKATEEKLKLFPNVEKAQELCESIKQELLEITEKNIIVLAYGDGCFKDPIGGIWEFADPVTVPACTDKEFLESSPNEVKLKAIIDQTNTDDSSILETIKLIKTEKENLKGNMISQGTTPRRYCDLLASLMDLTSGSGDKGTPVVLVKNYFNTCI